MYKYNVRILTDGDNNALIYDVKTNYKSACFHNTYFNFIYKNILIYLYTVSDKICKYEFLENENSHIIWMNIFGGITLGNDFKYIIKNANKFNTINNNYEYRNTLRMYVRKIEYNNKIDVNIKLFYIPMLKLFIN